MGATVEATPRKQGYVIRVRIRDLGLDTTFQSNTSKKRSADKLASSVNGNARRVSRGELTFGDGWSTRDKLHLLKTGHPPASQQKKSATLHDAVQRYLESRRQLNKAHNTVECYKIHLRNVTEFFGNCDVDGIKRSRIQEWIASQCETTITRGKHVGAKASVASVKKRVAALKRLLGWLKGNDEYDQDFDVVFRNLEYPIQKNRWDILGWQTLTERLDTLRREQLPLNQREAFEKVYLAPEEVGRLLEVAESKLLGGSLSQRRLFYALCFAVYTSSRRSEIVRVRRRDIDLDRGFVRLVLMKGRGDQAYRYLNFPIHPVLSEILRTHLEEHAGESLFTSDDAHLTESGFDEIEERSKGSWLGQQLKDALAGTEFELCSGWHIYRHSFISAIGETLTPQQAMVLVGHQTEGVHLRYRHAKRDTQAAALESLSYGSPNKNRGTEVVQNSNRQADTEQHRTKFSVNCYS